MAKQVLDDKIKQAIDTYGERIETLKDFVTAVRKVPGMYITFTGNRGYLNMIREVFQNSIDQLILSISPCDHIMVYYNEKTLEVTVEDNGLGLPFDSMLRILTSHHTSGNYTKKKGEYSTGRHGSGLKVVNALSSKCIVESYHYSGAAKRLNTKEGYPEKDPYDIPNKTKKQGTKVTFYPCIPILGELSLDWNLVYMMIKHMMSLTPIGSQVTLIADDIHGVRHEEHIINKDGIITELITKVKNPIIKPIVFGYDNGTMKLDIALCYDSGTDDSIDSSEFILSFCNITPTTDGGTHVDGTVDGICRWFTLYMNNIYLNNQKSKNKIKVTNADVKSGMNLIVSAAHLEPIFGGQGKDTVNNPELEPFCKEVVMKGLDEWSKNNPQDLAKLSKYLRDIAEIRQKSESDRVKIVSKYSESVFSSLPEKYKAPTGDEKEGFELFIVEGDSAGGSAKSARLTSKQGIFPIRGKILNVFNSSRQKILNNAEVQGILDIIFNPKKMKTKYKKNFDPYEDVPWEKIIFMSDADVDGSHIAVLLLRLFIMFLPQLIVAGKVYKAVPPLYGVDMKKKGTMYFTEQIDVTRYYQKSFSQKYVVSSLSNRQPLSARELTVLLARNSELVYLMDHVATTWAIHPELLELVLVHQFIQKKSFTDLKKVVKAKYRFMDVTKTNGIITLNGTIDQSNRFYLIDKLLDDCKPLIDILKENTSFEYLVNGEITSIYKISKLFDNFMPSNLQRYKGLGEMDAEDLFDSTMDPEKRTLIRYTMDSAMAEIEAIRDYESAKNLSKILDLVGTVNREDLLG